MKAAGVAAAALASGAAAAQAPKREYGISLAAWSLHKMIGRKPEQTDMLEMPKISKNDCGIDAIELVNQQMRADTTAYLDELAKNAAAHNVEILLIMVDGMGNIGSPDEAGRKEAIEKHSHWIDCAAHLGCKTIRMNWGGAPRDIMTKAPEEVQAFIDRSVAPFRELCDYGDKKNINVIIENHGGASSHPTALIPLMKAVDHPRFGTLPDFGNFYDGVDKYDAVDQMMPYAKAVSAKCYDFDPATGLETKIDFEKMIQIVVDKHHYNGHIGIEYEGGRMPEIEGVIAARKLLEKLRA